MRDIVVAHPGVQHSGALAAALHETHRLRFLATRLQVGRDARWPWSAPWLQAKIPRRVDERLPDRRIRRLGAVSEIALRGPLRRAPAQFGRRAEALSTARFARRLIALLDDEVRVVIGTDTASEELFRQLRDSRPDVLRVLDVSHPLPSTVQPLIRADAERWSLRPEDYDDYSTAAPARFAPELDLAHLVIVASRFSAESIEREGVHPNRIVVVPYGVGPSPSLPAPSGSGGPLRALFLGAISERKGITVLLRAMEHLERIGAPVELIVAGKSAGNYSLPTELPGNTTVVDSPDRDVVGRLYRGADVLVLPSMCEGFGRTILEAMSHGCAVLATSASGAPDVAAACPDAPITVLDPHDRDQIAERLHAMAGTPDESRAHRARAAASHFSEDRYRRSVIEAVDDAYRSLVPR